MSETSIVIATRNSGPFLAPGMASAAARTPGDDDPRYLDVIRAAILRIRLEKTS